MRIIINFYPQDISLLNDILMFSRCVWLENLPHEVNIGKGAVFRTGFQALTRDIVIVRGVSDILFKSVHRSETYGYGDVLQDVQMRSHKFHRYYPK